MSEPTVIKPTVGRVVIFRPATSRYDFGFCVHKNAEHAAIVANVHGDRCVNLTVSDLNGKTFPMTSVTLRQPGDPVPAGDYCEWMPYQVVEAQKRAAADESERLKSMGLAAA